MNYGKKSAKKKSDKLSKGRAKNKKKFAVTFFKTALICILVLVIAGAVGGGIYAVKLIKQCPDISEVNISPEGFSTTVLDAAGNEIETLAASGSNRSYVPITDIPKDLQHAFVAKPGGARFVGVNARDKIKLVGNFLFQLCQAAHVIKHAVFVVGRAGADDK